MDEDDGKLCLDHILDDVKGSLDDLAENNNMNYSLDVERDGAGSTIGSTITFKSTSNEFLNDPHFITLNMTTDNPFHDRHKKLKMIIQLCILDVTPVAFILFFTTLWGEMPKNSGWDFDLQFKGNRIHKSAHKDDSLGYVLRKRTGADLNADTPYKMHIMILFHAQARCNPRGMGEVWVAVDYHMRGELVGLFEKIVENLFSNRLDKKHTLEDFASIRFTVGDGENEEYIYCLKPHWHPSRLLRKNKGMKIGDYFREHKETFKGGGDLTIDFSFGMIGA